MYPFLPFFTSTPSVSSSLIPSAFVDYLLSSCTRKQFLSKAFVCCCFLVFRRIGENISQNVFCFIWWRRLKTVPAWMINILLLLISTILTDIDVVKFTRVPGSLRSKTDAVYACCPNSGRYSFTFTTATVTVVVTAWEGSVSRAVIWKQNHHSVTLLF